MTDIATRFLRRSPCFPGSRHSRIFRVLLPIPSQIDPFTFLAGVSLFAQI